MSAETKPLRGFGMVFDLQTGALKPYYVGDDGIRRWSAADKPVDTPTPDAPEPMEDDE